MPPLREGHRRAQGRPDGRRRPGDGRPGETSYLGAIDVAKIHDQLKQATRAKLRPAGGRGTEVKLSRDTPCTIGKAGKCTIPVSGLLLGGTATIRFEGEAWIASFDGLVSGLSVNGSKVRQVALQPGDLVRVGSGEYRFIID